MTKFESAFKFILGEEGEYSNDPLDRGHATKYGISLRFLQSLGNKYNFDGKGVRSETIKNLTLDQAKEIYYEEFWKKAPFGDLENPIITHYFFHMTINMGAFSATRALQHALWAVGYTRNYLKADGIFGSRTLNATNNGGICLFPALRATRAAYYMNLVLRHPEQKKFLNGWLNTTYGKM